MNLVNWKEVDYTSSVISRCWNGVGFSLAESSFPLGKVLPFSGKNAKFARRATTFWLEYAAEEKENRKRIAKVWETLASIPSNERQSHSVSTRRRKYFTFRYHLMRGSKEPKAIAGNWWEKWSKKKSKVASHWVSLIRIERTSCGDNFYTLRTTILRGTITNYYRKRHIITDNGKVKRIIM